MLDEKTYYGEWWLPEYPEKRIKGTFTFSQSSGARLELTESFDKPYKTIYGENGFGYAITLLDCIPLSYSFPDSPYHILANQALLGGHFLKAEDVLLDSFHFQLSNLDTWLSVSGMKKEGELFGNNIKITYISPAPVSFWISPDFQLKIDFQCLLSQRTQNNEISLKQIAQISFTGKRETNVNHYLQMMHHFRNFLCLITQESVYPKIITGLINKARWPIDILYKLDTPTNTESYIYSSLFMYKEIENKFELIIQNWFLKYDNLEPIVTLYFGSLYGRFVYLNLKFLSLVQALETYHRRMVSNEVLPKKEHKKRISEMLASTPKKYETWLKNQLAFSNEPTLRDRLQDLLEMLTREPIYLMIFERDFIEKVVATRNYMNHYSLRLKNKTIKDKELYWVTEKLKILVELCLLKEMGLSMEEISSLTRQKLYARIK